MIFILAKWLYKVFILIFTKKTSIFNSTLIAKLSEGKNKTKKKSIYLKYFGNVFFNDCGIYNQNFNIFKLIFTFKLKLWFLLDY